MLVKITKKQMEKIIEALDYLGDNYADTEGYSSGVPYWNLKDKFSDMLEGKEGK